MVALAAPFDHLMQLAPVDFAEAIVAGGGIPDQVGIRCRHAQRLKLRHGVVDEFLSQLIVAVAFDFPRHALGAVGGVGVAWAEHHQHRPPEAIDSVLQHGALRVAAVGHRHHRLVALALVEAFLFADFHHRSRIGAVGRAAQRHLVDDGGAVDQPADHADIRPVERGVIEDRGVLHLAVEHLLVDVLARTAEGLGGAVEVQTVAGFVLHLGQQHRLAAQRGGARQPVGFRQHADDFRVGVLANLPNQVLTVGVRHPVFGLNGDVRRDLVVEMLLVLCVSCHACLLVIRIFHIKHKNVNHFN